jgi:membrane-bound lytic murein transglycosylase D
MLRRPDMKPAAASSFLAGPFRTVATLALVLAAACTTTAAPPRTAPILSPGVSWDIANLPHQRVDYWVERFSTPGAKRDEFAGYLARKPQYEAMIREKLRSRGMPQDLLYLAMIESGFNPQAHSAYGAAGIWQLVPDTARRYGLRVDDTVDERHDPEKSTDAALAYLAKLYDHFKSWYLAIAAYNAGENRVARVMVDETGNDSGTDADYYRIREHLPAETRDFVPVMIAAARIGKEPERYGFGR